MNHIILWAVIALVILILGGIWQRFRQLKRRSRRKRGNNYLYQEHNYNYEADYDTVDHAWDRIQEDQQIEEDLNLDLEKTYAEDLIDDSNQDSSLDDATLNQAIEGYLSLELDLEEFDDYEQDQEHLASAEFVSNQSSASKKGNPEANRSLNLHQESD